MVYLNIFPSRIIVQSISYIIPETLRKICHKFSSLKKKVPNALNFIIISNNSVMIIIT